ncbi:MAG TPA: HEAT repeat domain-containing protein [Planctomycetota bacterium]|nr:HEAT repeat domain-containing protein [Planctomycetota bacterium]
MALLLLLAAACADRLDGRTAEEWANALADPDKGQAAHDQLAARGTEAVPILVALVETAPPKPRIMAASLLARLGPEATHAVPALAKALKAKDRGVRGMAAIALGRIGPGAKDALVPLDRALSDRDVRVRVAASLAIFGITGDTAAPTRVLFATLKSPDPDVRAMVAEAFDEMGTPILGLLERSLENPDEATREAAAQTLGAMGPGAIEAKPALLRALEDKSEAVRAAAAAALQEIER